MASAYPSSIVDGLLKSSGECEVIETHVSWVLLSGAYAYKLKKPLDLGFLDYSTLEKRRFFCEEEVRLNKPFCPEIYLEVIPVTYSSGKARLGGDDDIIDYAVRMNRFDQSLRLDAQLESGRLGLYDMSGLAEAVADRHRDAPVVAAGRLERTVANVPRLARENFDALAGQVNGKRLQSLQQWTETSIATLQPVFARRFHEGRYRECHGDLHLGNLVRLPSGIRSFDCIEFSDDLKNTDVMADVAFLVMDLAVRRRLDLAAQFLNRYLELSGDYDGMRVFNFYFVYRCLVRAKIAAIRSRERNDQQAAADDIAEAELYCRIAARQTAERHPVMVLMHGFSGCGKTHLSQELMDLIPAIRVRSDIERKRLFGKGELESSESSVGGGIYRPGTSSEVYTRLLEIARMLLETGHNVIVDATFLTGPQRDAARKTAAGFGFCIVSLSVDEAVLRQRIRDRSSAGGDASEASTAVLEYQLSLAESLDDRELRDAIVVGEQPESAAIAQQIKANQTEQ